MFAPRAQMLLIAAMANLFAFPNWGFATESETSPASTKSEAVEVTAAACNAFAIDLYRSLSESAPDENLFFSPYSLSQSLAMIAEGARGQTAQEIADALHFPKITTRTSKATAEDSSSLAPVHTGFATLNEQLNAAQNHPRLDAIRQEIIRLERQYNELDSKVKEQQHAAMGWFAPSPKSEGEIAKLNKKQFSKLLRERNRVAHKRSRIESSIPSSELLSANSIWGDLSFHFDPEFERTVNQHYGSDGIQSVDFRSQFDAARREINSWCSKRTKGHIDSVVPPLSDNVSQKLQLAVVNAVYFRADWETKFDVAETKLRSFTLANGAKSNTSMMHGPKFSVRYAAFNQDGSAFFTPEQIRHNQTEGLYPGQEGFSIVELPYRGDEVVMLVISPNHHAGLGAIEANLTAEQIDEWTQQLKRRETNVFLPKFRFESEYDLKPLLVQLGIKQAFGPTADFTGLDEDEIGQITLGMIRHKTMIDVNETSTEAAVATFVGGIFGGPPMKPFIPDFRADRPFLYLIRDVASGTILFVGKYAKPAI
ncbi:MAG: serpin family protein [Aureliella sp.]